MSQFYQRWAGNTAAAPDGAVINVQPPTATIPAVYRVLADDRFPNR